MDSLTVVKLALFLLGTGCLVYVSRASLAAPRSHGFPRLFGPAYQEYINQTWVFIPFLF